MTAGPPPNWQPPAPGPTRPRRPLRSRTWLLIAVPIVALLGGIGIGSGNKPSAKALPAVTTTATATISTTATVTTTPTKVVATHTQRVTVTYTPPLVHVVTDGTYVVGTDIPPGIYKTPGGSDCYYARLSSLTSSDIIDNGNFTGPTTIQVSPSDKALELNGGCTWSKVG